MDLSASAFLGLASGCPSSVTSTHAPWRSSITWRPCCSGTYCPARYQCWTYSPAITALSIRYRRGTSGCRVVHSYFRAGIPELRVVRGLFASHGTWKLSSIYLGNWALLPASYVTGRGTHVHWTSTSVLEAGPLQDLCVGEGGSGSLASCVVPAQSSWSVIRVLVALLSTCR